MDYTSIQGYEIPKITLGTVALGIDYGVFKYQERPKQQESFDILSTALEAGINMFDTARGYGDAEKLIGEYSKEHRETKLNIVTKFKISPENIRNKDQARTEMLNSVRTSLRFLKLDRIPICLFHMDPRLPFHEVLDILPGLLADLKHEGLIDLAGISADHPGEVESYLEHPILSAIQVPMNIFDQRLIHTNMLKRMHEMGKIVFVRSVFLKGLFFMPPSGLKGNLTAAGKYIQLLQEMASDAQMSVPQLAFSYIRDLKGVTSIVFGAEKADHVKQTVELIKGNAISADLRKQINATFNNISEDILTPRNWSL